MANKDTNKKVHKDAINREKVNPKYGSVYGEWHECGSHYFKYENVDEPEKFYEQKLTASGSYKHTAYDKDDKEHVGELFAGEGRKYVQGGWSDQFDGHNDINGECTIRTECLFDMGRAVGGDLHDAVKGQRKEITKGGQAKGQAGASLEIDHNMNNSTTTQHQKGDKWNLIDGFTGSYTSKSNIQYTDEEDLRHTGGNYDRYTGGKYHVFSKDAYVANTESTFDTWSKQDMTMHSEAKGNFNSKEDMTIESDSKITIKVGSSKITITSSKITIEAAQIEVKASGSNDLEGHPLRFNGGGPSSTPFTLP